MDRDAELIEYVDNHLAMHKYAPSTTDVGQRFTLKSKSTVHQWLSRLRREGRVNWVEGTARTLHTTKWEDDHE